MLRMWSWNINQRDQAWREIVAAPGLDVVLLQEARRPPEDVLTRVETDLQSPWETPGSTKRRAWRTAIARASDRVAVRMLPSGAIGSQPQGGIGVSRPGTVAAAEIVINESGERLIVASLYGLWETPVEACESNWIYADASVHRLISDLSALVGSQQSHRIIAAGDLNILRGYGEQGSAYWQRRYHTIFERMEAIGLPCVGPALPEGGHPPLVRPSELPGDSTTVPTFRTNQADPLTATRQLDFVFASSCLANRIRVYAVNDPENWGVSDHCRLVIELD